MFARGIVAKPGGRQATALAAVVIYPNPGAIARRAAVALRAGEVTSRLPILDGMTVNASDALAPRRCRTHDLVALIGLLAVIEGELMVGEVPEHLAGRIRDRLERAAILAPGGSGRDVRQSVNDLNHRLRYALGEFDVPPSPEAVPQ
nr:hypothetical protein [uncultured Actinoplanes sp.]